jgi:hypothetical protein
LCLTVEHAPDHTPPTAIPNINLFIYLRNLITTYPSPASLREALLAFLYASLREALPGDPEALKLYATRKLNEDLHGEEFVNVLQAANEELRTAAEKDQNVYPVYAQFVDNWCQTKIDRNLVSDDLSPLSLHSYTSFSATILDLISPFTYPKDTAE